MGKRVTRFMSLKEWQAFQRGERLVNSFAGYATEIIRSITKQKEQ